MVSKFGRLSILVLVPAGCLLADFSYEQTSQITGGMMAGMMKVAGVFSKQAREPIQATVAVKGDRMVHWSPVHASIIDLAKETITSIDMQKKTYSVMTFAEMKEMMEKMAQRMKEKDAQGEMNFKVSVNPTGQTKQVSGFEAKEIILKMEMEGTDQKTGQKGGMTITTDMWVAPKVAGYQEVADFYRRMSEKISWSPGGNFMMGRPDVAKGMAEVYKEVAKIDGMPVYQVIKMGVAGMPEGQGGGQTAQQSKQQQQQQQVDRPSAGSILGGRLGRFGGLGRKKSEPKQEEQASTSQAPPPSQGSAPAQQGDASGALMEMTSELSGFSSAPVDPSKFEVPAGFKQVQPDTRRMQ